jgi:uncharacterized Zn-finger protein
MTENIKNSKKEIIITRADLPLSCPINKTWAGHPKIYLDIKEKKKAICPYCGNIYKLIE